jgi:hypothetical protein
MPLSSNPEIADVDHRLQLTEKTLTDALTATKAEFESRLRYFGIVNVLLVLFGVAGGTVLWDRIVDRAEKQIDRAFRESAAIASAAAGDDDGAVSEFRSAFAAGQGSSSELFFSAYLDSARRATKWKDVDDVFLQLSKADPEMRQIRSPRLLLSTAEAMLAKPEPPDEDFRRAARIAVRATNADETDEQAAAGFLALTGMLALKQPEHARLQFCEWVNADKPFAQLLPNYLKPPSRKLVDEALKVVEIRHLYTDLKNVVSPRCN